MKNKELHKQIPKNIFINILSFGTTIFIGIWMTPYLLDHIGIAAYGLVPLSMFFSQYVGVVVNSLNMSIGKYLLIALHKNDVISTNKIFNTSLGIVLAFILLQLIVMMVILFDLSIYFKIPKGLENDALWLFGLTFAGFSVSLVRSVFSTSLYAYNRIDILRTVDIFQNLARAITIVILFMMESPSLKSIGIANFLSAFLAFIPILYFFKIYSPQIKITINDFDFSRVRVLAGMSFWILVNQVGVLFLGNIDLYFVNQFVGAKATGEYAIIVQLTSLFRTLAGLLVSVMGPVILIYHANGEFKNMEKALVMSSKILAVFIAIVLAISLSFTQDLLHLWLGEDYVYLDKLVAFSLLFLLFAIPIGPLFQVNIAYNKVKLPALITIALGSVNILMMYLLLEFTDLGLWAIVLAKLVLEFSYNAVFMPIYVAAVIPSSPRKYITIPIISTITFVLVYILVSYLAETIDGNSFYSILVFSFFIFILLFPILLIVFLTKEEKSILFDKYLVKFKNKFL